MKENCARIVIILDRSGSMNSVREATVAGFNDFIRKQREYEGEVTVKLVQFDDQYEVVFDKPLAEVPELTQDTFVPRGYTALYDAQGKTIVALGEELEALPESERPSKVIVMTLTDGLNNASREYRLERVAELIRHQTQKYNWDFIFLGANQDAVKTATSLNINVDAALTFGASAGSLLAAFDAASVGVLYQLRTGERPEFSQATREAVLANDDKDTASPIVPDRLANR